MPTKSLLAQWRDDMLVGRADDSGKVLTAHTINARLSAARKLLRSAADDTTDITVKFVLQDWAKVEAAKATVVQDKIETDYGRREKGGLYSSQGEKLSARKVEDAINSYQAEYSGQMTTINCHDRRRTYAKLCKQSSMSWEALRANMGHSSVTVTEKHVGLDVDWTERVPNWTIEL